MFNSLIIIVIILLVAIILVYLNKKDMEFYYKDTLYAAKAQWNKFFYSLKNKNLLDKPLEKKNKVAIITFENRNKEEYIEIHNKNILEYCKKWGYDYLFYDKCEYNVYWCKMYYVLNALKSGKYDYVLWMDSDTIIKNKNISIDLIVNKYSSDIFVSCDNGLAAFCAGVFIIKNSNIGITYIEDCIKSQQKNCIIKNTNKLRGIWAGLCYEQGIMNMLIFDKYYNYTTCLPSHIIHNGRLTENNNICDIDTFILHLYITPSNLRTKCFKRFE